MIVNPTDGKLGPVDREQAFARFASEQFDVLIVGGGVVGAGAALDASLRGLEVALVEAHDWASGTSSRSSKLLHGGLRYLEMLDFGLVREALRERDLQFTLAPHLVRPVEFLFPLTHRVWERAYVGAGIALYDAMAGRVRRPESMTRHRHLGRKQAISQFPGLRGDALVGAIRYSDAQIDDARHTLTLVRSAAAHGAVVANQAGVVSFLRDNGRIVGAQVSDTERPDRVVDLHARSVINATGVWTDDSEKLADTASLRVRMSKGVHLVVPRDGIEGTCGLISRTEHSVLFVIPWDDHWIVGTTDTPWTHSKEHPAASHPDIDYVLQRANAVLRKPLSVNDIHGVFVGLRPLIDSNNGATTKLSREHAVSQPMPGLTVIAGGKYTTYRVMAEDAVDAALDDLNLSKSSVTATTPLLGADGYKALQGEAPQLAMKFAVAERHVTHLLNRYGDRAIEVLELIQNNAGLGATLPGTDRYLAAEVVYAVTHEGARHVEDVLARRTRMSVQTSSRGTDAADAVASIMGTELGWSEERMRNEADHYIERVRAERAANNAIGDESANEIRLAPGDIASVV